VHVRKGLGFENNNDGDVVSTTARIRFVVSEIRRNLILADCGEIRRLRNLVIAHESSGLSISSVLHIIK
jgi:hypothetical protein